MADEVVTRLRAYQQADRANLARFAAEPVRMTRPVPGVRGVGIGDDPAPYGEMMGLVDSYLARQDPDWKEAHWPKDSVGLSFSQYRSAIIFAAMRDALKASNIPVEQDAAVKTKLVEYFELAGLDPANPSVQGKVTDKVIGVLEDIYFWETKES